MGLCKRCARLAIDDFDDRPIIFQANLAALKSSAEQGCAFCSLCWASFLKNAGESVWDEGKRWTPTIWLYGVHFHDRGSGGAYIEVSCGKPKQVVGQQEEESNPSPSVCSTLEVYELPGCPSKYRLRGRRTTTQQNPEIGIPIIQGWLHNCRTNHRRCRASTGSAMMPTRVIDVGGPAARSALRLVSSKGICEPYIALSYCWGVTADEILTLTAMTFASMTQGIRESALAKTHRDTVSLAQALGIRYIWVDALCIIQGDEADWERESRNMAQVYGNATLTVVAGRSADARNGYMDNTLDSFTRGGEPPPCRLPVSAPVSGNKTDSSFLMVALPRSADIGPVFTRGWCSQERVCCRRAVIFGTQQLMFECETEYAYENGKITRPLPRFAFNQPLPLAAQPRDVQDLREATLRKWYNFLYVYTTCHLSNPHDIFAAIAAIAQQAARVLHSRYLAGIWECDIIRGLLWEPCYHMEIGPHSKVHTTRPKPTRLTGGTSGPIVRAPSWSWAAVMGPVAQESGSPPSVTRHRNPAYARVRPARGNPKRWTRGEDDTRCGADKLRMPALELRLVGRLAPARVLLRRGGSSVSDYLGERAPSRYSKARLVAEGVLLASGEAVRADQPWGHVVGIGFFDVREEGQQVDVVHCLLLVQDVGLLLEKSKDGSKFSRLGWFRPEREAWFSEWKEAELCLY
ncbi:hypothetical protein TOPH_08877 [Tolypocladium ophioglossoides CBS 100239]|uniref:Heterokaryon incompatibility domain-containing protein n=1 Tax=Tolypocladium ophioglossoides (strain CBS 100239) TaxID=1163406 RepID=A0A0L0MXH5_TOLOC|nr:hypothetical protein TOPH_08877 [Tolypocladium ophioglossoides CBS 100239]